ncbi:CapA family protein [bacterium]|nr:CapA family protein [bacterium]
MRVLITIIILIITTGIGQSSADELPLSADNDSQRPMIRFMAVGDIMLGRGVGNRIRKYGTGWLCEKTSSVLHNADVLFGNLESPLTTRYSPTHTENVFMGNPKMAKELTSIGFNVLSVANNHAFDQGRTGLQHTLNHLKDAGIIAVGGGIGNDEPYKAKVMEKNGVKIAFIGAQNVISTSLDIAKAGIAQLDVYHQIKEIKSVRSNVDFIVVSLHWGGEYVNTASDKQKETAHRLIDAGADIIIGHHPHVLQGIERYNGGLIAYSLGNFAFDQRDEKTKRSVILVVDLAKDCAINNPKVVPIAIIDFRPEIDLTSNREKTIKELEDYSRQFGINGVTSIEIFDPATAIMPDVNLPHGVF